MEISTRVSNAINNVYTAYIRVYIACDVLPLSVAVTAHKFLPRVSPQRALAAFACSAVSLAGLAGCGAGEPGTTPVPSEQAVATASRVRVAPVGGIESLAQLSFPAVTRSAQRGALTFQVPGNLAFRLEIGDNFAPGDTLARLDNPSLQPAAAAARQQLAQARSQREQAARDLARVRQLREGGAATQEELERVESSLMTLQAAEASAQAQANQARRLLAETRIKAPFAGTIAQVFAEPGEYVQPGQPVLSAAGGVALELEIALPEALALQRQVGERLTVLLPFLGRSVDGRVVEVARAAPDAGRLFPLVVALQQADALTLRAGMTAEVQVPLPTTAERAVPLRAVVDPGSGEPRVFRLDGDKVRAVRVEVGDIIGERVVVVGDLAPGDMVVVSGVAKLIDGETVTVLP